MTGLGVHVRIKKGESLKCGKIKKSELYSNDLKCICSRGKFKEI